MKKMWGGRFKEKTDPIVEQFTSSIAFDRRLAKYDCLVSIAHAKMLGRCQIISQAEAKRIVQGLKTILDSIERGSFKTKSGIEDIHTEIQSQLQRLIGPLAGKLHTARSRNDLISQDMRMYCKDEIDQIIELLKALQKAIRGLAKRNLDVIIAGHTHLQQAQPVLFAHLLLAYCEMFARDIKRLINTKAMTDVLTLGSGALAGTSLPIDRAYVANLLGLSKVSENSIDSVSDRDFAIELVFNIAMVGMHLSRLCEDFIIWSSFEFGLLDIDERFCTGSSLMPHKKNPDTVELIRGKTGRLFGNLTAIFTIMKGLPLSYNRDMQEDKIPLFDSVDTLKASLEVLIRLIPCIKVNRSYALKDEFLYATDIAEYLVKKGLPFRDAHDAVGGLVRYCIAHKKRPSELPLAQFKKFSKRFEGDIYRLFSPRASCEAKRSYGSTNPNMVRRALARI